MARSFRVALVLVSTAIAGCGGPEVRHQEPDAPPVPVTLSSAHEETLDTLYRASGTVRGRTTAVLTSKTTGYVRSVDVRPGDVVRQGQVLAVLEANDSAASVRRARAGLDQSVESRSEAENAVHAAQAALRIAKSTHERVAALYASKAIAQQEYDESDARLRGAIAQEEMAKARLRGSSSRIDQAKAEIGEAQATLDYARIIAPFAGRVIERRIDPGNLASPGMPLLVVEEEGKLRVETAVEESRAASVALGDQAIVEIEALPQPVTGTVGEIVPDRRRRVARVPREGRPARRVSQGSGPGCSRGSAFASAATRGSSFRRRRSPRTARSIASSRPRAIALRLRMVTLGETQGPWTEVLSGLGAGERVVAAPAAALRDGARFTEKP